MSEKLLADLKAWGSKESEKGFIIYESALEWMMATDNQKHLDLFFANTRKYDKMREEDTLKIFPEWKEFFDKYEKN